MAIATLADVRRMLDAAPPSGTARIVIGDTGNITETDATAFLDGQEAYIIARLGFTPLSTNKLIIEVHAKLTAYHIWIHVVDISMGEGIIPDYVKEWKNWAEDILAKIKSGEITIPSASEEITSALAFSSNLREVVDEAVVVDEGEYVLLSRQPILPMSERLCSEVNGGGTIYSRNEDYKINYPQGEIFFISGRIDNGKTVYISYIHVEKAPFYKPTERVKWSSRSGITNWEGLFRSDR